MRGTLDRLASPHPLSSGLPALLRGDRVTRQLCSGLDEVLAPILLTLDCFSAYLDGQTAPDDFLPWLCSWVGLDLPLAPDRRRAVLAAATELNALRGTCRGIELALRTVLDVEAEVEESGGVSWSSWTDAALPGSPDAFVHVTVRRRALRPPTRRQVEELVRAFTPAHVEVRVEMQGETVEPEPEPEPGLPSPAG